MAFITHVTSIKFGSTDSSHMIKGLVCIHTDDQITHTIGKACEHGLAAEQHDETIATFYSRTNWVHKELFFHNSQALEVTPSIALRQAKLTNITQASTSISADHYQIPFACEPQTRKSRRGDSSTLTRISIAKSYHQHSPRLCGTDQHCCNNPRNLGTR